MSNTYKPKWALALAILGLFVLTSDVFAQRGRWGQSEDLGLLVNDEVQAELDLVDDQVEGVKSLELEMRSKMRDMFNARREEMSGKSDDGRRKAWSGIQDDMKKVYEELKPKVDEILLPEQLKRLAEIKMQSQMKQSGGILGGQAADALREKLNISDEQLAEMKEKAKSASKKLEAKVAKLRLEAEAEVMSVLSAEQRDQYKMMMGETFKMSNDRGRFGNRTRVPSPSSSAGSR
jgi:hypothetical protein